MNSENNVVKHILYEEVKITKLKMFYFFKITILKIPH